MPDQQEQQNQRHALNIIRFVLLAGIVTFGGLAWVMAYTISPQPGMAPEAVRGVELYVDVGMGVLVLAAFGGVVGLRSRWQAAEGIAAKRRFNILGWAIAEVPALLGGVYLMIAGRPLFLGAGMALMGLALFVLLPLPASE